jgi:hypothetical protein
MSGSRVRPPKLSPMSGVNNVGQSIERIQAGARQKQKDRL